MLAIFAIGVGLTNVFGRMVGNERQGWAILAAMGVLFLAGVATAYWAEAPATRRLPRSASISAPSAMQAGGNMEGKEVRFGIANSALCATITTDTSCGAVNSMHDSFTAARRHGAADQHAARRGHLRRRRLRPLRHAAVRDRRGVRRRADGRAHAGISRQEARGQGGQDDDARHLVPAAVDPASPRSRWSSSRASPASSNAGPHGFTEILYAFTEGTGNNGSAFAGLSANTPFYNTTIGLAMLIGRFFVIVPMLAIAGSLAAKKIVAAFGRHLPDRQRSLRRAAGRRHRDRRRPDLLPGRRARAGGRAVRDEAGTLF